MIKPFGKWLVGLALVGLFGLLAPGKASASGIVQYDITGTLTGSGGPLSFSDSWVDINTSTGLATDSSITIDGYTVTGAPDAVDTSKEYEWCPYGCGFGYLELTDSSGFQTLGTAGDGSGTVYIFLTAHDSGTVALTDPPSGQAAPEPSTLLMLGAGLLGLFATTGLLNKSKLALNQAA